MEPSSPHVLNSPSGTNGLSPTHRIQQTHTQNRQRRQRSNRQRRVHPVRRSKRTLHPDRRQHPRNRKTPNSPALPSTSTPRNPRGTTTGHVRFAGVTSRKVRLKSSCQNKKPQKCLIYKANQQGTSRFQQYSPHRFRPDVIKRAVLAIQSSRLQPQGRDPMAGKRTSAESRGTGSATARVPRIKGGSGRAAFAPSTVKGRQPHPPRAEKKILKSIPKKEAKVSFIFSDCSHSTKRDGGLTWTPH